MFSYREEMNQQVVYVRACVCVFPVLIRGKRCLIIKRDVYTECHKEIAQLEAISIICY